MEKIFKARCSRLVPVPPGTRLLLNLKLIAASTSALGLIVPVFGALSGGTIINMDFHDGNGIHSGAGVIGTAGDQWNLGTSGSGIQGGLFDSNGVGTSVSLFKDTAAGGGAYSQFQWGTDSLDQDYIYLQDADPTTITLGDGTLAGVGQRFTLFVNGTDSDLHAGQVWDLHMIGAGDNAAQGANFMLKQNNGSGDYWITIVNINGGYGGLQEGANYGTFSGVNPTAWSGGYEFELYWYWTDPGSTINGVGGQSGAGGADQNTAFNGFQLELTSVPEPGTPLLWALGALALLLRRRR